MKRPLVSLILLTATILTACSSSSEGLDPEVEGTVTNTIAVPSATPLPPTETPTPEPPTETPLPTITRTPVPIVKYSTEVVSLTTEDDYVLEGKLFLSEGDENVAIVFAHMAGGDNDQENWVPFAKQVAKRGYTALTFNFRCYGESECGGRESGAVLSSYDIGAAIDLLSTRGFGSVICIGASMGGRSCINAAFDRELSGIVIVAGTGSNDPDRQNLENFVSPDMPKLFIVGENDHIADRTLAMTNLYQSAPEPKIFKTFPSQAHGTELFDTSYAQAFREAIYDFLEGFRSQ